MGGRAAAVVLDLKSALLSSDFLAYPRDDEPFALDYDASNRAIGGGLCQLQWSLTAKHYVERPFSFASKSFDSTQRRYCATRRELLAVVTVVAQFRHYLQEKLLRTDCSS